MARRVGGPLRGWALLGTALAVLLVLAAADQTIKNAPHGGYHPEGAELTLYAAQWPAFWANVRHTDAVKAMGEDVETFERWLARRALRRTGIRPTPARWRLWMGPSMLAASHEGTWGACVRPGMLLRGLHLANRLAGGTRLHGRTYRVPRLGGGRTGELWYGWRDGFLIVSASQAYVEACFEGPAYEPGPVSRADALDLAWGGRAPGRLQVSPEDGLPVRGVVSLALPGADTALHLTNAWPEPPVLSLGAGSWAQLAAAGAALRDASPMLAAAWDRHGAPLAEGTWGWGEMPADWSEAVGECAVALVSVEPEGLPVPTLAALLAPAEGATDDTHPWAPLAARGLNMPMDWGAPGGVLVPWMGAPWSLCLSRDPATGLWLAATREAAMARLPGAVKTGVPSYSALELRLDWPRAGETLSSLLARAADLELVPGWNEADLSTLVEKLPVLTRNLGSLQLRALPEENQLRCEGNLAAPEPAS